MKGIVVARNLRNQRYAVETDFGYTVFDLRDGSISVSDVLSGCLEDPGDTTLRNESTGSSVSVHIEAIKASPINARSLLVGR
jgi:hypothetical protein